MRLFLEQKIGAELVLLDPLQNDCHNLSAEASFVRDGEREGLSQAEIIEGFERHFPTLAQEAESAVAAISERLRELGISAQDDHFALDAYKLSRRGALKVAGVTLISSILAPRAASASSANGLEITQAFYQNNQVDSPNTVPFCGNVGANGPCQLDITAQLQARVTQGTPDTFNPIACSNASFGDPCSGTLKECTITYCCNGVFTTIRVCENQVISIPSCP